MPSSDTVYYLCRAIVIGITSLACWMIVCKEYTKRKATKETEEQIPSVSYQKWLNRWSILTMILFSMAVTIIPLNQIYILCKWIKSAYNLGYMGGKISTTFYQIARLQYCFAEEQVHSKYGYSKGLFIFLYSCGVIGSLLLVLESYRYLFVRTWHHEQYTGCDGDFTESTFIYYFIGFLCYYIWDLTVFICYIIKVCQFYKKTPDVQESVSTRIKFIVYKIAFLTFILELSSMIMVIVYNTIWEHDINWFFRLFLVVIVGLDYFISVYMVYLMLEHNDKEYVHFIKVMNNVGIFSCFKSFVDITLSMDVDGDETKNIEEDENKDVSIDTATKCELPERIEQHGRNYTESANMSRFGVTIDFMRPNKNSKPNVLATINSNSEFVAN